jgi:cytochrome c biogenesis protein CcmG, thiol:disulfide interchange protein DsbE
MMARPTRRAGWLCLVLFLAACGNANGSTDEPDRPAATASSRPDPEVLAARLAPCPPSDADAAGGDDRLPDVTLACLGEGDDVTLSGLSGQPAVINVWATWCGPCREEMPYFQALYDRAGEEVLVLGVDYDDPPPERALAFADELGLRYAQVADPDALLKAPLGLSIGIPATLFVDAEGRVVERVHKPYRDEAELFADVRTYLRVSVR